ncbi:MAG: hypothetical protein WD688_14105 [Candidatus Binatia bacterium]
MNGLQSSISTSSSLGQMYPQAQQSYASPQWSHVVLVSELSQCQIEAIRKLLQLLTLSHGWDSYDSPPPSEVAIMAAVRLILGIDIDYFVSPRIVPVSGGGVQLEWSFGSREVEIEINDERLAGYLKSIHTKPIEEAQVSLADLPRIRALLTWLMT